MFIDFFQLSVDYILKKKYLVAVAKQFILRIVVDWFSQKVDLVINELLYSVACAEFFLGGGIFEKFSKFCRPFLLGRTIFSFRSLRKYYTDLILSKIFCAARKLKTKQVKKRRFRYFFENFTKKNSFLWRALPPSKLFLL